MRTAGGDCSLSNVVARVGDRRTTAQASPARTVAVTTAQRGRFDFDSLLTTVLPSP